MQIINQYSLIIFGLVGLIAVALVLMRRQGAGAWLCWSLSRWRFLPAGWSVRPTATPAAAVSEVRAQIGQGLPVLLELQSPY